MYVRLEIINLRAPYICWISGSTLKIAETLANGLEANAIMGLNPVPIPTGKSEGKIDKARLSEGPNF